MIRNEKGASSIIVILLMIVLIVLGLAAFSASYSNYRLGQKTVTWSEEYYLLEKQAEEKLFIIDRALIDSFNETKNEFDYFSTLFEKLNENNINPYYDDGQVFIRMNFKDESDDPKNLSVVLKINYPENKKRYSVIEWLIWQEPFLY